MTDTLNSRSPIGNMFGKCDDAMKVCCTSEMKLDFIKRANELGIEPGVLHREVIAVYLYGVDAVRKLHEERFNRVHGVGND